MSPPHIHGMALSTQLAMDSLAEDLKLGVAPTSVGTGKVVKRRTTFSISPEHMQEAQRSFRQQVAVVTEKKSFFGDLQADTIRRDSAIDLDDDDNDDVITPPPIKPDTDYTPHEINAKDYMDKVLRGKIKFSPVKGRQMPLAEEVKRRVMEKANQMAEDGVLMVKSDMHHVASVALPDQVKT
jgi:hypothetical protein